MILQLTFKTVLEINGSYLMSYEKPESNKGKGGNIMNLTELPRSFFHDADILIFEQMSARFQMQAEK